MVQRPAGADAGGGPAPDLALDLAVTVECEDWTGAIAELDARAWAAVDAAVRAARADGGGAPGPSAAAALELGLVFTDDAQVHALNWQYRHKDAPTNVLAFENTDAPPPGAAWQLGDVVMAFETCRAEAEAAGIPVADHAIHLVVHGILHLFGYDHLNDGDARRMEGLEIRVLSVLGIADPYGGAGVFGPTNER